MAANYKAISFNLKETHPPCCPPIRGNLLGQGVPNMGKFYGIQPPYFSASQEKVNEISFGHLHFLFSNCQEMIGIKNRYLIFPSNRKSKDVVYEMCWSISYFQIVHENEQGYSTKRKVLLLRQYIIGIQIKLQLFYPKK